MLRFTTALFLLAIISGCDSLSDRSDYRFDQPVTVFSAQRIYTGAVSNPVVGGLVVGSEGRILATLPLDFEGQVTSSAGEVERVSMPEAYFFSWLRGCPYPSGADRFP
jgi:hypothetical protein